MARWISIASIIWLIASAHDSAFAQNAGDVVNMFGAIMRAAIIDHTRAEWSTLPLAETSCIEQGLGRQRASIDTLVQNGILPTDPRMSSIRSGCKVFTLSLPSPQENKNSVAKIPALSAKPTFDCTKARSSTAQIVCLDQAGASADWSLTAAYWAKVFSLDNTARQTFDQAHETWLNSLNQTCQLPANQSNFSSIQRTCVVAAYRNRAELYRSQLSGEALSESSLSPEQHAQIQAELIRLGYLNDVADGEFGPRTRAAIRSLQAQSGSSESDFLTAQQRQQLIGPTQVASTDEISDKASRLSPKEAVTHCESSDTETRLWGYLRASRLTPAVTAE